MTRPNSIKFEGTFNIWNNKYSIIVVANDPKVPGINLIFPKPNIVTNKELNILIMFC